MKYSTGQVEWFGQCRLKKRILTLSETPLLRVRRMQRLLFRQHSWRAILFGSGVKARFRILRQRDIAHFAELEEIVALQCQMSVSPSSP